MTVNLSYDCNYEICLLNCMRQDIDEVKNWLRKSVELSNQELIAQLEILEKLEKYQLDIS